MIAEHKMISIVAPFVQQARIHALTKVVPGLSRDQYISHIQLADSSGCPKAGARSFAPYRIIDALLNGAMQ